MNNNYIYKFIPKKLYSNNKEMQEIAKVENEQFNILANKSNDIFVNSFLKTSNIDGIKEYENILGILPDTNIENIEQRRETIKTELSLRPPFTEVFIYNKLNSLFGENNWEFNIDYNNYTIYITIFPKSIGLYSKFMKEMRKILPCNLIINYAIIYEVTEKLQNTEKIERLNIEYGTKLNIWKLGITPFIELVKGDI